MRGPNTWFARQAVKNKNFHGEVTVMRIQRHASAVYIFTMVLLSAGIAAAQGSSSGAAPAGAPKDPCAEFEAHLKIVGTGSGTVTPEQAEKAYAQLVLLAQLGEACSKNIADAFRTLRAGGAQSSWSKIEQELDKIINAHRSLIDKIEGTGGLIEEVTRALPVLEERKKEVKRLGGDAAATKREEDRHSRLKDIVAETQKQKMALDKAIVQLQEQKAPIAFEESGKQWDAAINALERFNKALESITGKLPRPEAKPGM
jgi:hypothetical protein